MMWCRRRRWQRSTVDFFVSTTTEIIKKLCNPNEKKVTNRSSVCLQLLMNQLSKWELLTYVCNVKKKQTNRATNKKTHRLIYTLTLEDRFVCIGLNSKQYSMCGSYTFDQFIGYSVLVSQLSRSLAHSRSHTHAHIGLRLFARLSFRTYRYLALASALAVLCLLSIAQSP